MKKLYALLLVTIISVVLIGCKEKGIEDVKAALGELIEKVDSYEVDAVLQINENNKQYVFDVNVKYYKTEDDLELYKVTLKNRDSNNLQVILKNEEGVFVINPTLNKSFKFQSDWPLNSSQPYLLQSLVKDVLNDTNAAIAKQDDNFVVETKVDYLKSKELVKQKIILDSKTLHPKKVSVFDANNNERINVLFNDMNLKPEFKDSEFYVQSTMATVKEEHDDIPVFAPVTSTFEPTYLISGTELDGEPAEVQLGNDQMRTIMTYSGERTYTIVQQNANTSEELATEVINGDIVILSDGVAFVTNTMLTWYKDGAMVTIVADMIDDDVIRVANSLNADEEVQK